MKTIVVNSVLPCVVIRHYSNPATCIDIAHFRFYDDAVEFCCNQSRNYGGFFSAVFFYENGAAEVRYCNGGIWVKEFNPGIQYKLV